jgi:exopolyphosphatase/pppGpp-phosphohydrolase
LKLAAIDIGTNAVRLLLAKLVDATIHILFDRMKARDSQAAQFSYPE